MDSTVAERAARPDETWRLEDIYPDAASFDRDRSRVEAAMPSLEGSRGRLHESAAVLREALDALEMPREGVAAWLDYLERFYRKHGAERRYAECLDLVASMRSLLQQERR